MSTDSLLSLNNAAALPRAFAGKTEGMETTDVINVYKRFFIKNKIKTRF